MNDIINQIKISKNPVVLLEGTRALPKEDIPNLVHFAEKLTTVSPGTLFRTGNASGTDEAFAQGVANVNVFQLEYVVPYATMRKSKLHKGGRIVSLDEVPGNEQIRLKEETVNSYPSIDSLVDYYFKTGYKNRNTVKAMYLIRDTLKVIGSKGLNLLPAAFGVFYVNLQKPLSGGTGHTIRVCEQNGITVSTQNEWLD